MAIRDLVPRMGKSRMPARRLEEGPLSFFQRDINRVFDDFFKDFGLTRTWDDERSSALFSPRVDVSETDREVKIVAELPGMDEKDVTVEIDDEALTIRGEKKDVREDKGENWHRTELSYGEFHRVVPLPAAVVSDKGSAKFRKGVLTVTLPKREMETAARKRIAIKVE